MVAASASSLPDTPPPDTSGGTPRGTPAPRADSTSPPASPLDSIDSILTDLAAPESSLVSVAAKHSVSVADLCLWLTRPDIRERMLTIESGACNHVRLTASLNLTRAVHALQTTLSAYIDLSKRLDPADPTLIRASIHARKSAWLLLQLARLTPLTDEAIARARRVIPDAPPPPRPDEGPAQPARSRFVPAGVTNPRGPAPSNRAPLVPAEPKQERAGEADTVCSAPTPIPAPAIPCRTTPVVELPSLSATTRSARPARSGASRRPGDLIRAAATTPVPLGSSP